MIGGVSNGETGTETLEISDGEKKRKTNIGKEGGQGEKGMGGIIR